MHKSKIIAAFGALALFACTLFGAIIPEANAQTDNEVPSDIIEYAEDAVLPHYKRLLKNDDFGYIGEVYQILSGYVNEDRTSLLENAEKSDRWLVTINDKNGAKLAFTVSRADDGSLSHEGPWDATGLKCALGVMEKVAKKARVNGKPSILTLGSTGMLSGFNVVMNIKGEERVITVPNTDEFYSSYASVRKYTELPTSRELIKTDAELRGENPNYFDENGDLSVTLDMIPTGIGFTNIPPHLENGANSLLILALSAAAVIAAIALAVVLYKKKTVNNAN